MNPYAPASPRSAARVNGASGSDGRASCPTTAQTAINTNQPNATGAIRFTIPQTRKRQTHVVRPAARPQAYLEPSTRRAILLRNS
jgi:hypothetical protein